MKATPVILLTIGMVTAFGQWAVAQDAAKTPDQYSPADLTALEKTLGQKTDATGTATETLEKFADFYFVVDGQATLVSGGQMVNGKPTAAGEVRGDSITDGKETKLKKGDIVHIPANIPHQLLLANGDSFQYFIIKVQEVN
jgi:mannose-6-phosphate isomerase-like protein (cupin superfamily)